MRTALQMRAAPFWLAWLRSTWGPPARRFYRVTARNKTFPSGVRHVEDWLHAGWPSARVLSRSDLAEVESMFRCATALLSFASLCGAASLEWPQWGGPHGDFKSDANGLSAS